MVLKIILFVLFFSCFVCTAKVTFEGHKVFEVVPNSQNNVKIVMDLQKQRIAEFWLDEFDVHNGVRITVAPEKVNTFLDVMNKHGIEFKEIIADLQQIIDNQLKPASSVERNTDFFSFGWDRYHTLEEIYNWLDILQTNYPDIVTTVIMGRSVEKREIKGIKINYHPERNNTMIGMIEGTIHAREWIAPATATWIIKEFLTSTDPEVRALAENIEWHIFPVVNPDGYVYTFTTHRMWRKNRSTRNFTSCSATGVDDDMSNGVDLNRNFDFVWMSIGATDNPCSNTFAGPSAFSEPETKAVADYASNLNNQATFIYYFALHSYSQLIVVPYSQLTAAESANITNYADMYEIARRGADKLEERFGTVYKTGVSADIMYPMSGTSFDWVKNETGVPVSLLIELRDLGEYGFLLPPEQIIPNNLEIMDALLEMDRTTRLLGYYSTSTNIAYSTSLILFFILFDIFMY